MVEQPAIILPGLDTLADIEGAKRNVRMPGRRREQPQGLSQACFGPRIADQRKARNQRLRRRNIEVALVPQNRAKGLAYRSGNKQAERPKPTRSQRQIASE
ncbi:MAG TPA: hypothetical protein VGJ31_12060 [Dongiaceae bacterium]